MSRKEFDEMVALAESNHVVMRAFQVLLDRLIAREDPERTDWTAAVLDKEKQRIARAVEHLHILCRTFEEEGLDLTVIKSLDHWPDLGSDLDLYTNTQPQALSEMLLRRFKAQLHSRSWGDRLACKWNFSIPGLPELLEFHVRRLGQTGELVSFARQLPGRARVVNIADQDFRVPCPVDRVLISTLQRMYRHFYFRLSDLINSANLVTSGALDFDQLRLTAERAGIWKGTAAYLVIVSDYVQQYSGTALPLPEAVVREAAFCGGHAYFKRGFLRVPIMPQSIRLYRAQMGELLRQREFHNSARLGLLPWLATAAAMGQKLTGSDKGIW
ncbi:MAG TPA: nucleotidyltransferase family protein [Acidobacteriaceae bacterium]|nr:nucleotidyltransferase family protein [Acidobacteriaceae bacterium]